MSTVLDRLPERARVAVVRLRSLGDCVLTTPALRILKQARPDLRVAVVVEDRFAAIFEGNPDIEKLLPPAARPLRSWQPDLCLNLHGGTRSAVLAFASGAPLRAGFAHFRYPLLYNIRIPRAQEILGVERVVHTAEHLASAIFYLGAPHGEVPRAALYAAKAPAARPYAVLHPAASRPDKTWPAGRFAEVAARLRDDYDLTPIFIGGPGDDLFAFSGFERRPSRPLSEIKTLLSGASLFVGNDSGPAHMAAAFQLPVVALFGSSDARVWHPWRSPSEVLVHPEGIAAIPASQVLEALARLRVHA
ncbi:MAG: glycosyltransferase family 9 protein [Acidobacteria bacterium]|nr:glycosyltransferase family 9 protein [Acidobacteriota bacterium]